MAESRSSWTWVDAWVLAAVVDQSRGADLSELIGHADALNHAIPTRDELASSLGALVAAGLVEVAADRYRTTSAGRALRGEWTAGTRSWSDVLLPRLAALPRSEVELPLTQEQVRTAYQAYWDR